MLNRKTTLRFALYILGMVVLALGISLNARTSLGVSPIVSVAFSVSTLTGFNFGDMTFAVYTVFVIIEIIIHLSRKMKRNAALDCVQILVSLIFTRFLNVFNYRIPDLGSAEMQGTFAGSMPGRILFLCLAVILTGVGAALSMNMRIVPNPGDGIVQTIGDAVNRENGFVKNCLDASCVLTTCVIGLVFAHRILGIGIGTLIAMIGVGRVIAVFNHFTLKKTKELL